MNNILYICKLFLTVIFVLRKKQNQVSKLHIFHHLSTVTLIYMLINHNENGESLPLYKHAEISGVACAYFSVFLNSIVHVFMYSYYFLAAVADKKVVQALWPVKKSITVMQMTQFALILVQLVCQIVLCTTPLYHTIYFTAVIVGMFYGFLDFYNSAYQVSQRRKNLSPSPEVGK
ncbi:elongation of very long chain fatty acids protein 5-like [Drosophila ficusphila]|uniref:elongation of very long chain fatty acids protein 5-like n=1 Tax=Drosophila ficusphila TaxID=30025 RepID=UPI001C8A48CA|nr:elongation of very long chain fatty acids protein 5-like [Drosophila ficusphila]